VTQPGPQIASPVPPLPCARCNATYAAHYQYGRAGRCPETAGGLAGGKYTSPAALAPPAAPQHGVPPAIVVPPATTLPQTTVVVTTMDGSRTSFINPTNYRMLSAVPLLRVGTADACVDYFPANIRSISSIVTGGS